MVTILSFRDTEHPLFRDAVNTTSRSINWSRGLSPFFCGPVPLYDGMIAENVENAWQYSKVYPCHYDAATDTVLPEYFAWAKEGWSRQRADRYPMGKGVRPLFSLWDGERLDYIAARRRVYAPIYAAAVQKTEAFQKLVAQYRSEGAVALVDFDGYNHKKFGFDWVDVLYCEERKMGHAFVLGMLLEGVLGQVLVTPKEVQLSLF